MSLPGFARAHLAPSACLLALTGGCAILYDFSPGNTGGASDTSGTISSGATTATDRTTAVTTTDATASGATTGGDLPSEVLGFLVSDTGAGEAPTPGLTVDTQGRATFGVVFRGGLSLGSEFYSADQFGVAMGSITAFPTIDWAHIAANATNALAMPGLIEARVAGLPSDDTVVFGTMKGVVLPTEMPTVPLPMLGAWMVRYDAGGTIKAAAKTMSMSRVAPIDVLPAPSGGIYLGLDGSDTHTWSAGMCSVAFPDSPSHGARLLELDENLSCGTVHMLDLIDGETLFDLAPRDTGFAASLIHPDGTKSRTYFYDDTFAALGTIDVDGLVVLADGANDQQFYCATSLPGLAGAPKLGDDILTGVVTILPQGTQQNVNAPWPTDGARCIDVARIGEDYLIVGEYQGDGFAGLPQANGRDGFLIRVAANGEARWAYPIGGGGAQVVTSVGVSEPFVYLMGTTTDPFDFANETLSPVGPSDAFVLQLSLAPD